MSSTLASIFLFEGCVQKAICYANFSRLADFFPLPMGWRRVSMSIALELAPKPGIYCVLHFSPTHVSHACFIFILRRRKNSHTRIWRNRREWKTQQWTILQLWLFALIPPFPHIWTFLQKSGQGNMSFKPCLIRSMHWLPTFLSPEIGLVAPLVGEWKKIITLFNVWLLAVSFRALISGVSPVRDFH